jgi:hypothetical protein
LSTDLALGVVYGTMFSVDQNRAALALSVVQGLMSEDPSAQRMALETFDSLEDASTAYAYLVGYLVEELAAERRQPVLAVITDLRSRMLE